MQRNKKTFREKGFNPQIHLAILAVLLICLFSCSQGNQSTSSKYLSKIVHDKIVFEDGNSIPIQSDDRIYFLVRHAEKDTLAKDNANLTEEGFERSYMLADIFRSARIDEVYSTMYLRTLMTADSISRSKGLSIKSYDPKSLKEFAEQVKNEEGNKRYLIVGHSNTTPSLANHILDKEIVEQFDESDYDQLLAVVERAGEEPVLHQLKFQVKEDNNNE